MNRLFFIMIYWLIVLLARGQSPAFEQVNSIEFLELIKKDKGTLLDVRTRQEFANGHIADAGRLNYYAFDFKKKLLLLPNDQPVYLYCNTGYRSQKAAEILIKNGYTEVFNLQHGIMEWNLKNLPVVVEPNARPDIVDKMDPNEFRSLIQTEKGVLIDFYAPWCSPCRSMMPMIDSLKTEFHGKMNIVKINADASKKLVKEQRIMGVPLLVMYKNGKMVFKHNGIISRNSLVDVIHSHLSGTSN